MAIKNPNRMNATRIESSVSDVRSFFRFRLHQMRWKNFMAGLSFSSSSS
jgi:hypothetical protein